MNNGLDIVDGGMLCLIYKFFVCMQAFHFLNAFGLPTLFTRKLERFDTKSVLVIVKTTKTEKPKLASVIFNSKSSIFDTVFILANL